MKKRLLVIFSILLCVVLLIVLTSVIFSVNGGEVYFYNQTGSQIASSDDIYPSDLIASIKGSSIFLFDDEKLMEDIAANPAFSKYFVVGITRKFPNKVAVHLTERIGVFYFTFGSVDYITDIYFHVLRTANGSTAGYVNINDLGLVTSVEIGKTLTFTTPDAQKRAKALSTAISVIWRFNYNFEDIGIFMREYHFETATQTTPAVLIINTVPGAQIRIVDYDDALFIDKLIGAISVYNSTKKDMTGKGVVITASTVNNKVHIVSSENN